MRHSVSQPRTNQIIQNVTGAETARVTSSLRASLRLVVLRRNVAFIFSSPSFLIRLMLTKRSQRSYSPFDFVKDPRPEPQHHEHEYE